MSDAMPPLTVDEKRALLRRLLAERAVRAPETSGDAPLAPGQLALWFVQKLSPAMYAYNVAFTARLRPGLDLPAFGRALDAVVARHAALRTVFPEYEGAPVQRVRAAGPTPLDVVDLRGEPDAAVHAAVCAAYRRPFDLNASALAITVFRCDDAVVLLVNVHHIVFDAWSAHVMLEELRALYSAEVTGVPPALPPLAAGYGDFVAWQAAVLGGAQGDRLWSYWKTALEGAPPALEITAARPRPPVLTSRGASVPFTVDPAVATGLRALARRAGTTLYTVLLATMQLMLHRFSGATDIVIGTPVSLRVREEWTGVIGYYINMLPIRGRVRRDATFADHLAGIRDAVLGALAHQEFPFALMVDRLKVRRESNRSPIFQAMLNVHASSRATGLARVFAPGESDGVPFGTSSLTPYPIAQQDGQFEIAIEVLDSDSMLSGNLKYQLDLYGAETAREMVDTFGALLAAVVADPGVCLAELAPQLREEHEL